MKHLVKHLGTIIGAAIAGMFVMSIWAQFAAEKYGIIGGWFAAVVIIGIMWFMNHYIGLINNDGAFVDMAVGIGVAGTMRDVFMKGGEALTSSLPTLIIVILGGICGGLAAVAIEKE